MGGLLFWYYAVPKITNYVKGPKSIPENLPIIWIEAQDMLVSVLVNIELPYVLSYVVMTAYIIIYVGGYSIDDEE